MSFKIPLTPTSVFIFLPSSVRPKTLIRKFELINLVVNSKTFESDFFIFVGLTVLPRAYYLQLFLIFIKPEPFTCATDFCLSFIIDNNQIASFFVSAYTTIVVSSDVLPSVTIDYIFCIELPFVMLVDIVDKLFQSCYFNFLHIFRLTVLRRA